MNKSNHNLKKNFLYQVLYNFITLALPLVVTPFLSRALLETALGEFTYSRSIASYFVVFSMMGIVKYGQRVISQSSDNNDELRKSFWSLFSIHVVFSLIGFFSYILFVSFFVRIEQPLFWAQAIYVASALFDVTWLFYGLENFKSVVSCNAIIKVIEAIIYIFLIKAPEDIMLYAVVNCFTFLISQIALFLNVVIIIKPIKVSYKECLTHFKPLIIFAIATVGITLYTVFDTTLLGLFSSKSNVAFYEYSNRIVRIPLTIATIIGTVLYPRACKLSAQKQDLEQIKYMRVSIIIVSLVGSASFWGLLLVAEPLAGIYFGENFIKCGKYIVALSPLVYIIGLGDVIRTQYMIPNGMDKEYTIGILINAVANILISTAWILNFNSELQVYGAIIGTLAAESIGTIYQLIMCRKKFRIKEIIKTTIFSFLIGAIMYVILRLVVAMLTWSIVSLMFVVVTGAVIFVLLTILYLRGFEKDIWIIFRIKREEDK